MPLVAAIGQSFALDGREACIQAIDQALQKIGQTERVSAAFLFVSKEHQAGDILNGAAAKLRNVPLFGFSTEGQITPEGQQQRSVVVALLAGPDVQAHAGWWPDFAQNSKAAIQNMVEELEPVLLGAQGERTALVVGEGVSGDGYQLCHGLPAGEYTLGGALTGGHSRQMRAIQIGGNQAGEGGLAAAVLSGNIRVGVGVAHGWQPVGKYFTLSRVEGVWVRSLNDIPAAETYAQIFGRHSRDWIFPPLNELIRLYPLGIEQNHASPLLVRSPLQVEVDGSFRMSAPVPEGKTAHLLVGSTTACVQAARQASREALRAVGEARPVLAIVIADIAWQMLFEAQRGKDIRAVREILGADIPIAGGYTIGQIAVDQENRPTLLNQHIEVILFGEPEKK